MRRAIGIVRVSRRGGREGESFISPAEQAERIRAACGRDGLELLWTEEEIEVSGGTPLAKRDGLRDAVEAIEAGEAEVLVVAYFDRLVRSLRVQGEVVSRVEAAGGQVLTVDVGAVSEKTASQWLSGTLLGAVAEYQRRMTAERSASAQAAAVARGVVPWNNITPGYRKGKDGRLAPDRSAQFVRKAFRMRAGGATIAQVRAYLRSRGIERSYHGVEALLSSRVVLGEIHFGKLTNLEAHKPIIDRELWRRVQRVKVPRGRRAKSKRLLARLGVLRCGTCGSRMVVGTADGKKRKRQYHFYRCPPTGDCPRRVTIGAEIVEGAVAEFMRDLDVEGRASAEEHKRRADEGAEQAQADLDAAIQAFSGLSEEPAAVKRLVELTEVRDEAVAKAEQLGGFGRTIVLTGADYDLLPLAGKRDFIRAAIESITISPGRGPERVHIHPFV